MDAAKSNDRRVRKATVLVYKDGQMKTFKQPVSTVVLLVPSDASNSWEKGCRSKDR